MTALITPKDDVIHPIIISAITQINARLRLTVCKTQYNYKVIIITNQSFSEYYRLHNIFLIMIILNDCPAGYSYNKVAVSGTDFKY